MFTNPFGLQSSLQYYLPYLTAVALAHLTLNTPSIDYSPFLWPPQQQGLLYCFEKNNDVIASSSSAEATCLLAVGCCCEKLHLS